MTETPYKLVLLEVERSFLAGETPETRKLQNALLHLKGEGIGVMLVVPDADQEFGKVHVLGYFCGSLTTYRRCLISGLLCDMKAVKGMDIGADDILYLADSNAPRDINLKEGEDRVGRERIDNWCRFENVGKGCDGLNAKLGEIFGNGIFGGKNAKDTHPDLLGSRSWRGKNAKAALPKPQKEERFPRLNKVLRALHLGRQS